MKTTSELTRALICTTFLAGLEASVASTLRVEYDAYTVQEDRSFVQVAVIRGGDLTAGASVDYATSDQTATAGEDYEQTTGTLEFAPNEAVKTVDVAILNDGLEEVEEQFYLQMSNPSEGDTAPLRTGRATVSIADNDPGVQFTWKHFWGYEVDGQITATVERGNDVDLSPFTVNYATISRITTSG